MKERFENRSLYGSIRIKMDDAKGYWEGNKAEVVSHIIEIANEYYNNGYTLTLRQLYYQLVARDYIPNHDKVYKKISSIKDDICYSGLLDWNIFEDRGRVPIRAYYEHDIPSAIQRTLDSYRLDRQKNQPVHIEVWTEKDAISGVLKRVTLPFSIPLVINKGYNSSSAMYAAYDRFMDVLDENRKVRILYFGDHDLSGLDMVRDIEDRLTLMFVKGQQALETKVIEYAQAHYESNGYTVYDVARFDNGKYEDCALLMDQTTNWSTEEQDDFYNTFDRGKIAMWLREREMFSIEHIGLTMAQIKQYNPPHNPAKITDPRAKGYIAMHGQVSWEVDALNPNVMQDIVRDGIMKYLDKSIYDKTYKEEADDKVKLGEIIKGIK